MLTASNDDPVGAVAIKLKEEGTTHWKEPNVDVTNETGFTALPGGYRSADGSFNGVNGIGYWWTTTEYENSAAGGVKYGMSSQHTRVDRGDFRKDVSISVRCVKD